MFRLFSKKKKIETTDCKKEDNLVEEVTEVEIKQQVLLNAVLINNNNAQMQWEIQQTHEGEKIDVEPDDDDRYLVSTKASYDIGFLNKRMSNKIDDLLNEGYEVVDGEIIEITENEGKFSVEVRIVLG